MKLSIITPVLDSHEIVRRQVLHYGMMDLPDDVEIIYVDDGSDPPIENFEFKNFSIYATGDKRPWTEHIARNKGARLAKGEYLLIIDVDYILPKQTIMKVREFTGDKMNFKRWFGILNKNGEIDARSDALRAWGLKERWITRGWVSGHRSQFAIRKSLFEEMGGYKEELDTGTAHPLGGGAGQGFFRIWQQWEKGGRVILAEDKPTVYMFPSGKFCEGLDYNPFGLFHNLSRECGT